MYLKKITGMDVVNLPTIKISSDSYIRLTFEEFRRVPLVHLISGLDENEALLLQKGVVFTEIAGYTEWISDTVPTVSIGWDWIIQPIQMGDSYYKRVGHPRSNLMLIDSQRRDFGVNKTTALIETMLDQIAWQSVIDQYIAERYAS